MGLENVPAPMQVDARFAARNGGSQVDLSKAYAYSGAFSHKHRRDAPAGSFLVAALAATVAAVAVILVILRCAKQVSENYQKGSTSRRLSDVNQCSVRQNPVCFLYGTAIGLHAV